MKTKEKRDPIVESAKAVSEALKNADNSRKHYAKKEREFEAARERRDADDSILKKVMVANNNVIKTVE